MTDTMLRFPVQKLDRMKSLVTICPVGLCRAETVNKCLTTACLSGTSLAPYPHISLSIAQAGSHRPLPNRPSSEIHLHRFVISSPKMQLWGIWKWSWDQHLSMYDMRPNTQLCSAVCLECNRLSIIVQLPHAGKRKTWFCPLLGCDTLKPCKKGCRSKWNVDAVVQAQQY